MRTIILDIETAAKPPDELAQFEPEFSAPSNYSKPEAIANYITEARAKWADKAALHAITGKLLLGAVLHDNVRFYEGDEKAIVEAVWEEWGASTKVVGFNIKGFDLPWLCQKSWCLGVKVPDDVKTGRWWNDKIVDLLEVWTCYSNRLEGQNLDAVCRACGFGGKLANGKDFGAMYATNREAALDYTGHELELQWKLAIRLGVVDCPPF